MAVAGDEVFLLNGLCHFGVQVQRSETFSVMALGMLALAPN